MEELFDSAPLRVAPAAEPDLSPDRRRTIAQAALLAAGRHPLQKVQQSRLMLHPQAAPRDDRAAPGRRCGNCVFREVVSWHGRSYGKCIYAWPLRGSHSAASDVRAWWPACTDHVYGDTKLSPDAARSHPDDTAPAGG